MKSFRALTEWFVNRCGLKENGITTVDFAKSFVSCVISLLIFSYGHTFNYYSRKKKKTNDNTGLGFL